MEAELSKRSSPFGRISRGSGGGAGPAGAQNSTVCGSRFFGRPLNANVPVAIEVDARQVLELVHGRGHEALVERFDVEPFPDFSAK